MITATEALNLTVKAIESGEPAARALSIALENITRAASEGKRSVAVEYHPTIKDQLIAAGFEVSSPTGMTILVVRW